MDQQQNEQCQKVPQQNGPRQSGRAIKSWTQQRQCLEVQTGSHFQFPGGLDKQLLCHFSIKIAIPEHILP